MGSGTAGKPKLVVLFPSDARFTELPTKFDGYCEIFTAFSLPFERGIDSVNRKLGAELTMYQCCEWGSKLKTSWQATNFMQVSKSSAGYADSEYIVATTLK